MTSPCGAGALAAVEVDAVEHRHPEAERLAGTGAGLADQVAAGERDRQGEFLDRERLDDADRFERGDDRGTDVEVGKRRAVVPDGGARLERSDRIFFDAG